MSLERPSAEEVLDRVRREAGAGARGRHRVYLGIAPGVGKTYTALEELKRRRDRNTDVVIGFLETHNRPRTQEVADALEVVPRKDSVQGRHCRGDGHRRRHRATSGG